MSYETLQIHETTEQVVELRLNRPELHNAFNEKMIEELTNVFVKFRDQKKLRLIVVTGEGPSFSAGADLNWMAKLAKKTAQENKEDSLSLAKLFDVLDQFPLPVIGRVTGPAYGGGVGLMAICDEVVMLESAQWGLTEVRLGLVPAVISPFVANKIGHSHARRLFVSGARVSAHEALKLGLAHHLAKDLAELDSKVQDLIKIYLEAAPLAQIEAKKLAKKFRYEIPSAQLATLIAELRVGSEAQEGMSALLEKRKPTWITGKGK